jgi:hypothetical protein
MKSNRSGLSQWTIGISVAACLGAVAACQPPAMMTPTCSFDTATPVMHTSTTISHDETWAAGVHIVPSSLSVQDGARLTISPCSEVRLGHDASIVAQSTAAGVDAMGTTAGPIRFVRNDTSASWGSLLSWGPAVIRLANATLDGGGTMADYAGASLVARGTADLLPTALHVEHVTVSHSTGLGVMLISAKFDATSTALTVTQSGAQPLYAGLDLADTIPTGTYTGNATDEILLQSIQTAAYNNTRPLVHDGALHDRGVPYHAAENLEVGDSLPTSGPVLLTIDAGVTVRFDTGKRLLVRGHNVSGTWSAQGALIVAGTAAHPVRFTSASATPAAGDWVGLYFSDVVDPRDSVSNAIVEYAGGDSQSRGVCESRAGSGDVSANCGVILFLQSDQPPASGFITATQIAHSAGCGFYRGWQAAQVDFVGGNTFLDVPGCLQTNVPDSGNACPTAACPMM